MFKMMAAMVMMVAVMATMGMAEVIQVYPPASGNALAGFTNHGVVEDKTVGNPAPSLKATGGTYAYKDVNLQPGDVLEFDAYVIPGRTALLNVYFMVNSNGKGQMFRLDARNGYPSGFAYANSFTSWTQPASGSRVAAGEWHHVKIIIGKSQAKGFIDGKEVSTSPFSFKSIGGGIAIHGDASYVTGGYFDNIIVKRGKTAKTAVETKTTVEAKEEEEKEVVDFSEGFPVEIPEEETKPKPVEKEKKIVLTLPPGTSIKMENNTITITLK